MLTSKDIRGAVALLREGKVIAYPTEAVFGLGCDPFNADAVAQILQIKQRPIEKGFILVASSWDQVESLTQPIAPPALYHVLNSWPGPTTWVFPANEGVPEWIRGQYNTIAVRVSDHPVVKALCEAYEGPIISTSANLKDQPPVRDYRTALITFGKRVALVLKASVGNQSRPTTLRDAITGEIIRP